MELLTLNEAAKLVKRSKSTLSKDLTSGQLQAFKNQSNEWQIEREVVLRAYPPTRRKPNDKTAVRSGRPSKESDHLQQQIETLQRKVDEMKILSHLRQQGHGKEEDQQQFSY